MLTSSMSAYHGSLNMTSDGGRHQQKVTDAANTSKLGLKSHQAARDAITLTAATSTTVKKIPTAPAPPSQTTSTATTNYVEFTMEKITVYLTYAVGPGFSQSLAKLAFWLLAWLHILQARAGLSQAEAGAFRPSRSWHITRNGPFSVARLTFLPLDPSHRLLL